MANTTADYKLFSPLTLGKGFELKNRIVLSPLTRGHANLNRIPSEIQEIYYEQRAGAGLLITEATAVSPQGYGWYRAPAMYTKEHAAGWKKIVDRVHAKGGKIVLQLWHMGRQSHPSFHETNEIVAPSAIRIEHGTGRDVNAQQSEFATPRALETHEIPAIIEDYRRSAELALEAGFDGVEVHGANGYLLDTFLQSVSNKRTDQYGGSFENRARILFEILDAVKSVWPSDRVGVRVSPNGAFADMGSEDNFDFYTYLLERLSTHDLAYLAIVDAGGFLGFHDKCRPVTLFDAKKAFKGLVIANNSYERETAEGVLRSGAADLVAFGRLYMSNPDLAERFANGWPLNDYPAYETFYSHRMEGKDGGAGYIDFPAYAAAP
ncbi:hypothetical protein Poli38472_003154 [Pythium oligandrum]|uniref:NADH:flavin oxidoreductase/NADH oxidase N-terminal domain-containing protein n=1 Tax=Pythium oligandrum TaxID=41045 RepID=A0A8K1C698_PYTOL|nr:hypothetical protein Poli38472_003154 [Pythium oligandrum]|eukprot:TMW57229.1 hypothetical protein Poli38472_003154 [Pythium oligandrum]